MDPITLSRWQFGLTTIYHWLFVPLTLGLGWYVAFFQTRYYQTKDEAWRKMAKFWGKLFLINFAIGVVTGIVQEFQFGMNWSDYSRFVGDIFGAPLAMEALAAFFVESTFLGLWIFGRGKLSEKLHLATIWLVAGSTMLSAYFILAANSWMQHPVGYKMVDGKAQLTSIWAVLTNSTALMAFAHTIIAALMTGALVVLAVAAWHLRKGNEVELFGKVAKVTLPALLVAGILTLVIGHFNGVLMTEQQPMKMAAADAVFETEEGAGLSLFAVGDFKSNPEGLQRNIQVPNLLSFIMTGKPQSEVKGINNLNAEYQEKFGPGEYAPVVWIAYWSWRVMIGIGMLIVLLALVGWYLSRKDKLLESRRFLGVMVAAGALPFIANSAGWIFTEMGRQPWVVFGLLKTNVANSPSVGALDVWITLVGFTLLYGVLAVFAGKIFFKEAAEGPEKKDEDKTDNPPLGLAY